MKIASLTQQLHDYKSLFESYAERNGDHISLKDSGINCEISLEVQRALTQNMKEELDLQGKYVFEQQNQIAEIHSMLLTNERECSARFYQQNHD